MKKCCNCGATPAKNYAVRPLPKGVTKAANGDTVQTLFFCDHCHDLETYPCSHCHEDIDKEYIQNHPKYYHAPCPRCGEPIDQEEESMLELKATKHAYYGSGNWKDSYSCWNQAAKKLRHWDKDYNCLYRFDLLPTDEKGNTIAEEIATQYRLVLFFILPRKVSIGQVTVYNIKQEDMEDINAYLEECWEYLENLWEEIC